MRATAAALRGLRAGRLSRGFASGAPAPSRWLLASGAAAMATAGGAFVLFPAEKRDKSSSLYPTDEADKKDWKVFSLDEMQDMVEAGRIVVAHQGSLYDMTDFTGHPGGYGRLAMAAGTDVEVFWSVYTQHNRGHVVEDVMRPYKIGMLTGQDMDTVTSRTHFDGDAIYGNDPTFPDLLTNTRHPYNAEGRLRTLTDSFITPVGRHFVRNHSAVPDIDPEEYLLTINGEGVKETTFTLDDLKNKFEKVNVTTVIQCNGNRREDFHYMDGKTPAFGPPHWVAGAIGNATWSGARLRDVIAASGMDVDGISLGKVPAPEKATQIGLLGYDHDECGNQYSCSFPFDKAIDPFGDCIVAYEMNGQPIPRSHGFPVRAIVPGHAGARNCKFLECVCITDNPFPGHSNWKQYAVHAPNVELRKIAEFDVYSKELKQDPATQEMPVQSMITSPGPGDVLSAIKSGGKSITVKGIAWGGGGSGVNRVDVSLDGGKNFIKASVKDRPFEYDALHRKSQWAWVHFEQEIPLTEELRHSLVQGKPVELELTSKALNASWNVQPPCPVPNWNSHGCCVNHWYRVPVTVDPNITQDKMADDGEFANKPSGGKFATPFNNFNKSSPDRLEMERQRRVIRSQSKRSPMH